MTDRHFETLFREISGQHIEAERSLQRTRRDDGSGGVAVISSTVFDINNSPNATVAGAVVRVQATDRAVSAGADGRFVLPPEGLGKGPVKLTVWAPGYFCTGPTEVTAGQTNVHLYLEAHVTEDNPDYEWLTCAYDPDKHLEQGCACAKCHSGDPALSLPVEEWLQDAHSQPAVNPRFPSVYADYRLDHPDTAGNCATCHVPAAIEIL